MRSTALLDTLLDYTVTLYAFACPRWNMQGVRAETVAEAAIERRVQQSGGTVNNIHGTEFYVTRPAVPRRAKREVAKLTLCAVFEHVNPMYYSAPRRNWDSIYLLNSRQDMSPVGLSGSPVFNIELSITQRQRDMTVCCNTYARTNAARTCLIQPF